MSNATLAPPMATLTPATTRTITLTGRPPVTIREDDWPVIAVGRCHEGDIGRLPMRTAAVRVRQHGDGRRLVYGVTTTRYAGEAPRSAGILLPARAGLAPEQLAAGDTESRGDTAATIVAVHQVAEVIGYPQLAQDAIADLPAEVL